MTEEQQKAHIQELLEMGNSKAEAFYMIGLELRNRDISKSDFFMMSERLGFPIGVHEEDEISQSVHVWLGGRGPRSSKKEPKA